MHLRSCNNVRLRPLNCKKPVRSFCGRCNCLQQCHKTGNTGGAKAAGRVQMHFSVFLCLIDLRFAICIFVRHTHTPSICNIRCRCNILKSVKHCHCAECWTETPSCSDVFTQSWLSHQKECSPKHDSNQAPPCNQCCCKRRSHLWMHTEAFDAHKPSMMHLHIASKMTAKSHGDRIELQNDTWRFVWFIRMCKHSRRHQSEGILIQGHLFDLLLAFSAALAGTQS